VTERIIIAGFGGQGIITLGKLIAGVAMHQGKEVTFFPSYGAEVRGGTAHCHVIVSDEAIYSPIVTEADTLLVMNQLSYKKFRPGLIRDGLLLINSTMTVPDDALERDSSATLLSAPATDKANELGDMRVANMVMLGLFAAMRAVLPSSALAAGLESTLTGRKAQFLEINLRAFRAGEALAKCSVP